MADRPFRKGDKVTIVLRGAGVETREDGHEVVRVSRGLAYIGDGHNFEDYGYDAVTGHWSENDGGMFFRRIERTSAQ